MSSFQISGRYNVHGREARASRAKSKRGTTERVESKRGKFLFDSRSLSRPTGSRNSSFYLSSSPLYKRLVPFLLHPLSRVSLSLLSSSLYAHPSHHLCSFCRPCSTYIPTHPPYDSSRVLTVYFDLDLREISRDSRGAGYVWGGISLQPIVIHLWNILRPRSRWNLLDSRSNLATTTETLEIEMASHVVDSIDEVTGKKGGFWVGYV